ncbi:D-glycero-alpha-D-manno-heptose-1,7-bisphosphate 7-phosphatase [Silvibacterium sp.]|uniref:D-glycero-alpha-D-manno-heptose-1,7-bisphosphate 7-phosphatase n=1 Tax=Silvibacterium sp. TaxID=1964179 RepID=UPI0039E5103A
MHGLRRAVFLDRDGVINHNVWNPESGAFEAPLRPAQFALIPGVTRALRQLAHAGYLLFLVSNQPNYAKGKAEIDDPAVIHRLLMRQMKRAGISFTGCFYCFHHPEGVRGYGGTCLCRKPSPYFLLMAGRSFDLHLAESWMVGDRATDVACGHAAGTRTIFVGSGHSCEPQPHARARDLGEAAKLILHNDTVRTTTDRVLNGGLAMPARVAPDLR